MKSSVASIEAKEAHMIAASHNGENTAVQTRSVKCLPRAGFLAAMLLGIAAGSPALAQNTVTTLASFSGNNGATPFAGLTLSGGTLYGTTFGGGANGEGVVFSVPASGGTPTALASFNGSGNGANPIGGVIVSGNALYGTTTFGGSDNAGVVYSESTSGGPPSVLATFS